MTERREIQLLIAVAVLLLLERAAASLVVWLNPWSWHLWNGVTPAAALGLVLAVAILVTKGLRAGLLVGWRAALPPRPRGAELCVMFAVLLPAVADAALTAVQTPGMEREANMVVVAWKVHGLRVPWLTLGALTLILVGSLGNWFVCSGAWRWLASTPSAHHLWPAVWQFSAFRALPRLTQARLGMMLIALPLAVQDALLNALCAWYWTPSGSQVHTQLAALYGNLVVESAAALGVGAAATLALVRHYSRVPTASSVRSAP